MGFMGFIKAVSDWMLDPNSWGLALVWFGQILPVMLFAWTVLQLLPSKIAGGKLFTQRNLWITLIIDLIFTIIFMIVPRWKMVVSIIVDPFLPVLLAIAFLVGIVLTFKKRKTYQP
jgi:hypothetical protein